MKKIRILYVGLSSNIGGIETLIYNLVKDIDKSKFNISFLIDKDITMPYVDYYKENNFKIYRTENRKNNYLKYIKDLKEIFLSNSFDIIHINIMSYSLFERIILSLKYSNAKVIVHSHNGGFYKNKYLRTQILDKIGRIFLKKYDKKIIKIACGKKAGNFAFKNNYEVFYNGIDIKKFKFSLKNRKEFREKYNYKNNDIVVGLVASLTNPKNHKFLIDIFYEMKKIDKNVKLLLIGDGYLKDKIKNKIIKYNLEDSVTLIEKSYEVDKIYSLMDVYVMPSLYEGLSISLCEAQINGLKCYTSTEVDRESDITGNTTFLSLKSSSKKWANEILKDYKRDKDVMKKINKNFTLENSQKKFYELYLKLGGKDD